MRICTGYRRAIRTRNCTACKSYIFLSYRESYIHPYGKLFTCRRPHCLKLILTLIGPVTVTFAMDFASFRFGPSPFWPLSVSAPFLFGPFQFWPLSVSAPFRFGPFPFWPLSAYAPFRFDQNKLCLFPLCPFPLCPFPVCVDARYASFLSASFLSAPFCFCPFPFRPLSGMIENADYAGFLYANFRTPK
jgi:hypothetical protein